MAQTKGEDARRFLEEIEEFCYSTLILTITTSAREIKFDLHRENDRIVYGYERGVKYVLIAKLAGLTKDTVAGVVARSFTERKDEITGFPVKELRGFMLFAEADRLRWQKISAEEMMSAYTTDAETGELLIPTADVVFC